MGNTIESAIFRVPISNYKKNYEIFNILKQKRVIIFV